MTRKPAFNYFAWGCVVASVIISVLILISIPASAQYRVCDTREKVLAVLKKHGEKQTGSGVIGPAVIEVYSDPDDGSWSIIGTRADGQSCLLHAGQNWKVYEVLPGEPT